jgi:hypothetical protein
MYAAVPIIIPARVGETLIVGELLGSIFLLLAVFHRGQAEIENLHHVTGRNQNVRGLQIAMHDSLLMRRFQRFGNLLRVIQRGVQRQGTLDRCARNQLHHQRAHPSCAARIRFFDPVNLRDVRMIQRSQDFCFALKASQAFGIARQRIRQNFDRD